MAKKKEKPGVVLYFDILPALRRLSKEEKGELFEAIMAFAQFGVVPEFSEKLGIAWDFIMPRLVADDEAYRKKCQQNSENANQRWHKDDATACDRTNEDANNANYKTTSETETTSEAETKSALTKDTKAELAGCKGGREGNLVFPSYTPLTESEEQDRRAALMRKIEQYPD